MSLETAAPLDMSQITAIIPAFNEGKAIRGCLSKLRARYPDLRILVINDGSHDDTLEEAKKVSEATVISHRINRGYGASLKTGIRAVRTPFLVWFDADNQHDPEDLQAIVCPVVTGELDANLGMRDHDSAYVVKRVPGKWVLRIFAQIIARHKIPDLNCGFRCFRTGIIRRYLHLLPNGFSASATSTLLMIKRQYKVGFCSVNSPKRAGGTSTVRILRDGFFTLALLLRLMLLFDAFYFFSVCALLQMGIGGAYSLKIMLHRHQGVPVLGALVMISGIITFFLGVISSQISEMRQERFEFTPFQE